MNTDTTPMGAKDLKRTALLWACPALRQLPPAEWDEALKRARETHFDTIRSAEVT